jgi:chromosome segregation ATPase
MEDIERMAHDLRAERIKTTNALKERARLKVENESLQQQLFAVKDSVSVTKSSMDSLKKDLSDMNIELEKSMNEGKHAKAVIERLEDTISTMEQEKIDLHKTGEAAAESSRDMQSQIFRLEEECLLLKGKLEASEEMVRKMEVETTEAVLAKSALEEANAAHLDKVRKKTAVLEGMRDRIVKAEALELANKQLTSANEALKVE